MKKIALVRGPNLNKWEIQNISPLCNEFAITAFASSNHNFDLTDFPLEIKRLHSFGQSLRAKFLRKTLNPFYGDYHDLIGLENTLEGYDIIHSAETSYYFTYQAARARKRYNSKLIVTVWENIPFLYNNARVKKNKQFIFENTDLFLAVTERAKEVLLLEGVPEDKIRIQPYGINIEHFKPSQKDNSLLKQFDCYEKDLIILFIANLYREKGIYDLLYAFKNLILRQNNNIKLLIAGEGKEENNVQRTIYELELQKNAKLIGSYKYGKMPKIHNLADIFVLPSIPIPSWQEQFGYVLIESMACRKPVISTLSGSIPEVVGDAGILIPPNDFFALSNALHNLINNSGKRNTFGLLGRERVTKYFDMKIVSNQFRNHYQSLI